MLVGVLGDLRVQGDDMVVVNFTRRMERRLLTALAALHPRVVTVDGLVDALWGDSPPASARKTLQTNVLRLRQVLGTTTIVTAHDGYRFGPRVRVDADEFERTGELQWWRGEPFADLSDWPVVEGRRTRLHELRRSAEDAAAECLLQAGRAADAVAELEQLVLEDPTRERRWTLLVSALVSADRRPEALRAYERARRTLAAELGIAPGVELDVAYRAALDGGRDDPLSLARDDPIVVVDGLLVTGSDLARAGDSRTATSMYVQAAGIARAAGDVRRFAEAVLGAAGDGVRVSLDATEEVLLLVNEALVRVPPGPTSLRSRLLARVAVLQSQRIAPADNELPARTALGIARALDEPALIAGALVAITMAVTDPLRRDERVAWIDELLTLVDHHPDEPWFGWAQPFDARERVLSGDIAGALAAFTDLDAATSAVNDVVGRHAATYGRVLAATVTGDWDRARTAAADVRRTACEAMFDEGTARMGEWGMLAIIDLLEGVEPPAARADIEWPTPEMAAASNSYRADSLARHGRLADAAVVLDRICPLVPDLARDGYWLSTLSMLASAAWLTANERTADLAADLLAPCVGLTVTDPGLVYRGSGAHFAGLCAGVLKRPDATALLQHGLEVHRFHGSTWMANHSLAAIQRITEHQR